MIFCKPNTRCKVYAYRNMGYMVIVAGIYNRFNNATETIAYLQALQDNGVYIPNLAFSRLRKEVLKEEHPERYKQQQEERKKKKLKIKYVAGCGDAFWGKPGLSATCDCCNTHFHEVQ